MLSVRRTHPTRTHLEREVFSLRRKAFIGLVVAVVVADALMLLSGPSADAQGPIRIGASLSLTGTYAKLGRYQHEGYQLCQKDLNAQGGLLGRKIEFVVYDDQSTPATGVRLYERLLTEDKVDVVMGPYSSPVTEAVANVTEKYKKVMVAPLAATTSIFRKDPRRKYIFMILSPAELYFDGLTDIATKRGLKTIAVINEDTLFSKAAAAGAVAVARKKGMSVVFTEAYPKGNTDFSGLLTKIKGANADVLAAATYFDDAVALTRQMKELNVNPKMFGVTIGGDLPEFYDTLKSTAEYVYGATQWEPVLDYPGNREFVESYKAEFKREPSYFATAGYAGCLVYTEGVKRAGSLDADRVREQILKLELRTPFGDFKVDADGVQIAHKMVTFQWQKEKKAIVWPDDLAQGKVLFPTPPWTSR
jgi:branched-chain amino acid transport system substrate-binding protein